MKVGDFRMSRALIRAFMVGFERKGKGGVCDFLGKVFTECKIQNGDGWS